MASSQQWGRGAMPLRLQYWVAVLCGPVGQALTNMGLSRLAQETGTAPPPAPGSGPPPVPGITGRRAGGGG